MTIESFPNIYCVKMGLCSLHMGMSESFILKQGQSWNFVLTTSYRLCNLSQLFDGHKAHPILVQSFSKKQKIMILFLFYFILILYWKLFNDYSKTADPTTNFETINPEFSELKKTDL